MASNGLRRSSGRRGRQDPASAAKLTSVRSSSHDRAGRPGRRTEGETGTKYAALLKENEQLRRRLREHANEQSGISAFATAAMRSPITGHVYLRGGLILLHNGRFRQMVKSEGGPWRAETGAELATLTEVVCAESANLAGTAHVARYTRADGERVLEVRTERIGDDLPLVVATIFDVWAVVNATRMAEAARSIAKVEALQEASRKKDDFLGMLSHELRNPLAPIRNSVYLLDRVDPGSEEARRAREVLQRQVGHLARLVDDLLDATRMERGKFEIQRVDLDLAELVRRTVEDHRGLFLKRGIALEVATAEPVHVAGDVVRIAQVIGNLLHNAAKFTDDGGRVTVSLSRIENVAEVRVRDTGVGMEAELVQHVFEPLTQGRQSLDRTAGGLGLGLALVKGVVEMHGGTVQARSAGPGKGSEFVIRLPASSAPAHSREPGRAPSPPPQTSAGRHVLVVEDNADAAASLADLLRNFGHDVQVARDGPSAVRMARASRPEVVLCDIGLPGMSGYEVAHALRNGGGRRMQLIAVTGYARPGDVKSAIEAGFDAHVAKPFDPQKIERLLSQEPPPRSG
jgi:signal transduction histidine kinase